MLHTKIICTLGPATADPLVIRELVRGGMDVARLNMAHGGQGDHRRLIDAVRAAAKQVDRPIGILADLSGPKIRVGTLPAPVKLAAGEEISMAYEAHAGPSQLPTTYEPLSRDIEPGMRVAVDDGLIELECIDVRGTEVRFRVVRGGTVRSGQGMNIPSGALSAESLTPKDLKDLDFALESGVEYVGLSFVRSAADVLALKERVGGRALVIAKIEMARALSALDAILEATDMVMVARTDPHAANRSYSSIDTVSEVSSS